MMKISQIVSTVVLLLIFTRSVRADQVEECTSGDGITIVDCPASGGSSSATSSITRSEEKSETTGTTTGQEGVGVVINVVPCFKYYYTGPKVQKYTFTANGASGLTILNATLTGDNKIFVGNFKCKVSPGEEKCYKYVIDKDAVPEFTLQQIKMQKGAFTIRGDGLMEFKLDDGTCDGTSDCPVYEKGYRLKINTDKLSHADAKAACEAEGLRLVVIKDVNMTNSITAAAAGEGAETESLWAGLERWISPGNWKWVDQSTFSIDVDGTSATNGDYTNWQAAASADGVTNEACMRLRPSRLWEDQKCSSLYMSVCECAY